MSFITRIPQGHNKQKQELNFYNTSFLLQHMLKKNAYLRCQWRPLSKLWNSWSLGQGFKEGPTWPYRKVTNVRKFIPLPYEFEKKAKLMIKPLSPLSKFWKKNGSCGRHSGTRVGSIWPYSENIFILRTIFLYLHIYLR